VVEVGPTELLFLRDAYLRSFEAEVVAFGADRMTVALDRTCFYPNGGGQPHDAGVLGDAQVLDVVKDGRVVWHRVDRAVSEVGGRVRGDIDWGRRHALMRTHTALHVLCGVIWHGWGKAVTGGNMEPFAARMDFEFDPLPEGFGALVEARVNEELAANRPIEVSFLPSETAVSDEDLIRTKTNLLRDVDEVRVVDIIGLDRQADGGTHVHSTGEVGRIRVVKTESKGKGNKRIRIQVIDEDRLGRTTGL
jgi:misacylated tRNA(Ala) deacylase